MGAAYTFDGCRFTNNTATGNGGGILHGSYGGTLLRCRFEDNTAQYGGGFYSSVGAESSGNPSLTNCSFIRNTATTDGGGMWHNGGSPGLINCLFSGNMAVRGAGLFNNATATNLRNCTFGGNAASGEGGGMYNTPGVYGAPHLFNCIVWGNSGPTAPQIAGPATITYSCVQDGWAGTGNISSDPVFVDAPADDLRLRPASPCIDAANNGDYPSFTLQTDLDGQPRFVNDPTTPDCRYAPGTCGTAPIIDMGAYEAPPSIPGDSDDDGDVDAADLTAFLACASGPAVPHVSGCERQDFDRDTDVDLDDFAIVQRCLSGEDNPADPSCAN
jgi:parallel beta-helix repeat protein